MQYAHAKSQIRKIRRASEATEPNKNRLHYTGHNEHYSIDGIELVQLA